MTCYQRHLGGVFEALGLNYDKANRQSVHEAIIELLHLPGDPHCPEVWASLKREYGPVPERLPEIAEDVAEVLNRPS